MLVVDGEKEESGESYFNYFHTNLFRFFTSSHRRAQDYRLHFHLNRRELHRQFNSTCRKDKKAANPIKKKDFYARREPLES